MGITTYQEHASWRGWHRHASLVPTDFVDAVLTAGGVPVLLPPSGADAEARAVAAGLDALLLVGGADIDPARYGAERDPRTGVAAPERDTWEAALLRLALAADRPVLGVCRGMQMINVLLGGTLRQHLPEDTVGHHQPDAPVFAPRPVTLRTDQPPGSVLGPRCDLPCFHHQGVETLGEGVLATGWSADGLVETLCVPGRRFTVGVQGHPEALPQRALFSAFAAAARDFRLVNGPVRRGESDRAA